MAAAQYDQDVFFNCLFDDDYRDLFDAIVFADLPAICEELELNPAKLPYNDYTTIVVEWILGNG